MNIKKIIEKAKKPNAKVEKLADKVIRKGKYEDIILFAKMVPNAPIDKMADKIIESGNEVIIWDFANSVPDAPIEKLTDAIIRSGNSYYMYHFAKRFKNAPIDRIIRAMMRLKKPLYIHDFFNVLIQRIIETKDAQKMYDFFISYQPYTHNGDLLEAIIATGDEKYIMLLSKLPSYRDDFRVIKAKEHIEDLHRKEVDNNFEDKNQDENENF